MKTKTSRANRSRPNPINHVAHFAERIESEGYGKGSIAKYRSNAQALRDALVSAKVTPADLTDELMDQLACAIVDAASAKDKSHCLYRAVSFRRSIRPELISSAQASSAAKWSDGIGSALMWRFRVLRLNKFMN